MEVFIKEEPIYWEEDDRSDDIDDTNDDLSRSPHLDDEEEMLSFRWNTSSANNGFHSVIVLNDRLMSETLLSDDDTDDRIDDRLTTKRRHEDDSDSEEIAAESLLTTSGRRPLTRRPVLTSFSMKSSVHSLIEGMEAFKRRNSEDIDLHVVAEETTSDTTTPKTTEVTTATTLKSQQIANSTKTSTLAALLNNPCLPPTPPSSQCGSDSEINNSFRICRKSIAKTTTTTPTTPTTVSSSSSSTLISIQPKNAIHGTAVVLTEEEKRTLLAEGYPIPQRFPLTKSEERSLKKVRRKIKNKISAQESRRKKKEYMEELERRVQILDSRVRELEKENKFLKQMKN